MKTLKSNKSYKIIPKNHVTSWIHSFIKIVKASVAFYLKKM